MTTDTYCLLDQANSMPFTSDLQLWSPQPSKVTYNYSIPRNDAWRYYQYHSNILETTEPTIQQQGKAKERQKDGLFFHYYHHYHHHHKQPCYHYSSAAQDVCTICGLAQHSHHQHNYYHYLETISSSYSSPSIESLQQQSLAQPSSRSLSHPKTTHEDSSTTVPASYTTPDLIITPAPIVDYRISSDRPTNDGSDLPLRKCRLLSQHPHTRENVSNNRDSAHLKRSSSSVQQYMHSLKLNFYKYYKGYRTMLLQPPTVLRKRKTEFH